MDIRLGESVFLLSSKSLSEDYVLSISDGAEK
jgi:hypothetical protein